LDNGSIIIAIRPVGYITFGFHPATLTVSSMKATAMSSQIKIEICVGDLQSALEAGKGGADRIELCDNLLVGGTTPSAGTIREACRRLSIPVHVLIRPRAGDFLPSESELAAMRSDILTARDLGAAGVVFGVLQPDGTIAREQTARLVELARPMSCTFHKAFDQVAEPEEVLDVLIELGIDRVLTSGGRPTALEGVPVLKSLVERADQRIAILAGGRLAAENLGEIVARTGVREVHLGSAVTRTITSRMNLAPNDGSEIHWTGVDADRVRAIVDLVRKLSSEPLDPH
jgi:copper homeostasis protein